MTNGVGEMTAGVRQQRSGKWEYVFRQPLQPGETTRKQKWYGGFPTQKAAKIARTEKLHSIDKKTFVAPSKMTVAAYMRQWIESERAPGHLRASTHQGYVSNIETHIIPHLGHMALQDLDALTLNAMYAAMATQARPGKPHGLSPRTVRYVHTIVRRALKIAVKQGLITRNVADQADPPKSATNRTAMRTWTADEVRQFLAHVENDRLGVAYLLAATTGARRGEVLGVRWRDLDLDRGRMAVTQTVLSVHSTITFSQPKTDKGRRSIALDSSTVAALREHKRRQGEEIMAFGRAAWPTHDLVFTLADGSPAHPDRFSETFDKHVRNSGLPRIRLHDLRHSHASLALAAGVHAKVVSERLGHSTINITLDTYSHVLPGLQEDAAQKVADAIFGT